MGMNFREYMNEEMAEKTFNAFNQVYKTEIERKNFQYIMTTKRGQQKYGETTIHLKYDLEGQKIGFRGFMRDITDKKKAEKIIEEENKKLKQLDKMRKEFVNRASHELKTPLTSIHGALQLIEQMDNNILNEDMKLFLDIAKKGSNRLKKLIFNLLDISRIDAKKFQIQKKKVNIVNLFKDCIKDMKYLLKERNLTISVNLPKKLEVNVDQIRIEQVLINLLSNAIKNTPPYGKIFISVKANKHDLLFYVKDNGIGLTKIELDKIFQKFSRIEREIEGLNISAEGSGLGLYISKEIVETHGGQIWAESKGRNEGATFYVRLPKEIV
jgi:signal transduction histidine kinase